MRNITAFAAGLLLTCVSACSSLGPIAGPQMVPLTGSVGRQIERVCQRHDVYVLADSDLPKAEQGVALEQSAAARGVLQLHELAPGELALIVEPVLDRHDAYVSADAQLDELEKGVYLGNSEGLRKLWD